MVERFEDLPRAEQISIFIDRISGDEKEEEILHQLALFTAYNIDGYNFARFIEYSIEQLVELLNRYLNDGNYDEENIAWNLVIDTLGIDKIWDIIDDIDEYIMKYLEIKHTLENLETTVMEMYTKI